jgi:ADP-ribose pyrophosphatase YjhB (NUDIX family)
VVGVGALIIDGDRILLVERGREPLKGFWSLPGGALETGETLHEGIRREVLEETGLQVIPVEMFEIFERIIRDDDGRPEYHYVLMDYVCEVAGGALQAGDDVSKVEWFEKEALHDLRLTEGTLGVILKAFEGYLKSDAH